MYHMWNISKSYKQICEYSNNHIIKAYISVYFHTIKSYTSVNFQTNIQSCNQILLSVNFHTVHAIKPYPSVYCHTVKQSNLIHLWILIQSILSICEFWYNFYPTRNSHSHKINEFSYSLVVNSYPSVNCEIIMTGPKDSSCAIIMWSSTLVNKVGAKNSPVYNSYKEMGAKKNSPAYKSYKVKKTKKNQSCI